MVRLDAIARSVIRRFDWFLRRLYGIHEFTPEEDCIFRLAFGKSDRELTLSDGTKILKGETIGEFHFWNERIPPMPEDGPDLAWGLQFHRLMRRSLAELVRYIESAPEWKGVKAFKGESAVDAQDGLKQAAELIGRLGFDLLPVGRSISRLKSFFEFWENIYLWSLIWTFNPASLKGKRLLGLQRCQIWISRRRLLERHKSR
ncbi:MAG TPA: hypothetical protein DCP08_05720 [Chloroflexi bacterium]|nr:hypothetical protein [Chloroflexota bacterium]